MALFITLLCISIGLICYCLKRRFSFWRRHGVEEWTATSIFGNFAPVFLSKGKNEADIAEECYKKIRGKFGGYYFFWKPILLLKDPELIKNVFIKDFECFPDRSRFLGLHGTDEIGKSIFFLKSSEGWKPLRMAFSHLFTPKRIKRMTDEMTKVCLSSTSEFSTMAKNDKDVDLEFTLNGITMDIITRCFLGFRVGEKEVFRIASHCTNYPPAADVLKGLLYTLHPQIYDFFGMTSSDKRIHQVFTGLVKKVLEERQKSNYEGDDFIEFLIQCKNGENKHVEGMSEVDIAAHVFTFFFGGHDTTADTASYALYEIAKNQEIQRRLRDEIEAAVKKNNGFTYDAVKDIEYLQWIILETTRMYPVLGVIKRVCEKPYKFGDFEIPVGTEIVVPCRALHYDEKYFEDPKVFKPERFADGNRPDVYMPFGQGPRICIGMRVAQTSLTLLISSILLEYNLKTSNKNKEPLRFAVTSAITIKPIGGLWIKMEPRNKA